MSISDVPLYLNFVVYFTMAAFVIGLIGGFVDSQGASYSKRALLMANYSACGAGITVAGITTIFLLIKMAEIVSIWIWAFIQPFIS